MNVWPGPGIASASPIKAGGRERFRLAFDNRDYPGARLLPAALLCLLLLAGLLFPLVASAQAGGYAGAFSRMGFGPRGMAMGNAMSAVTSEGIYPYYNPAFAPSAVQGMGRQMDLSTSVMSFDRSLHKLSGSFALPSKAGIAVSIINARVSNIDGRTASGYHTRMLSTSEFQVGTAFGIRITPAVRVGIGIKYYLADLHPELQNATSFGFDIGGLFRVNEKLNLGVTVRDLMAKYSWDSGSFYGESSGTRSTDHFPWQVRLGGSCQLNENLMITLEPGILLPREDGSASILQVRGGGSYHLHERVSLRAGWQLTDLQSAGNSNTLAAGFSLHLPFDLLSPSIDYAVVPEPNRVSMMHVFGLQLTL
ncbi:MAG: hypothetical protein R3281_03800 [Balneolaceae bacterium]|nr:hypothetical protein [Balneolaceae bacterium]